MPCMTEISNKAEISENVCDDRDITRLRYQTMSVMAEISHNEFVVSEISMSVMAEISDVCGDRNIR